jgi:para-nitrobenzyl esterase
MNKTLILFVGFLFFIGCSSSVETVDDENGADESDVPVNDEEKNDDQNEVESYETVDTTEGVVKGSVKDEVISYKGIPFAKAPVGDLRWAPPAKPEKRDNILEANEFRLACPQIMEDVTGGFVEWDEDCLYLNVYRPDTVEKDLPVMVFIHGGGFIQGAASFDVYEGTWLASKDLVLVTINYRLGQLGFLTVPDTEITGNYGTLDQIAALEWIKDNIENFGGDARNITLFGESAGGLSVGTMLALRPDLFKKAIIQSAWISYGDQMSKKDAEDTGEKFVVEAGCENSDNIGNCLRKMSAKEVLETLEGGVLSSDGESYGPHVDGELFTDLPYKMVVEGEGKEIPLIIGTNGDEGTIFTVGYKDHLKTEEQYETLVKSQFGIIGQSVLDQYPASDYESPWHAYTDLFGDVVFYCTSILVARDLRKYNENVRYYHFIHVPDYGKQTGIGSFHGAELGYLFNTWHDYYKNSEKGYQEVTDNITNLWVDYAYGKELEEWAVYGEDENYLEIFRELEMSSQLKKEKCDFWSQ